jgi:hypothetical protein
MVLYGTELPDPHAGERGVLAVGAEEPLVVGEAGAEEPCSFYLSLGCRIDRAGPGPTDLEVLRRLHGVGEVLLAPVYGPLQPAVPGNVEPGVVAQPEPVLDLLLEQGLRAVGEHVYVLLEGGRPGIGRVFAVEVRAGDRKPYGLRVVGGDVHVVEEPAALEETVGGVVATLRGRRRVGARGRADDVPLWPPVGPARLRARPAGRGGKAGADDRGPVVGQGVGYVLHALLLPEHELAVPHAYTILLVELGLGWRGLSPRVCAHQLRVGVHLEREVPVGVSRRERQADEHRTPAIGNEVRAGYLHAVPIRQLHLHVTVAAGEFVGRPDPPIADTEPEAVEKFYGGAPDAAHLPAGVEPHGRIASHLGAYLVGPVPRGHEAAVFEPVRGRESRRIRFVLGRRGYGHGEQDQEYEETPRQRTRHASACLRG